MVLRRALILLLVTVPVPAWAYLDQHDCDEFLTAINSCQPFVCANVRTLTEAERKKIELPEEHFGTGEVAETAQELLRESGWDPNNPVGVSPIPGMSPGMPMMPGMPPGMASGMSGMPPGFPMIPGMSPQMMNQMMIEAARAKGYDVDDPIDGNVLLGYGELPDDHTMYIEVIGPTEYGACAVSFLPSDFGNELMCEMGPEDITAMRLAWDKSKPPFVFEILPDICHPVLPEATGQPNATEPVDWYDQ